MEIMERFIRLNRSILDCDLEKGGWQLDEEGIAVPYREGPTEMRLADA